MATRAPRTFRVSEFLAEVPRDAQGRWTSYGGAGKVNQIMDDRARGPRARVEMPPAMPNVGGRPPEQVKRTRRKPRQFWKPKPALVGPAQPWESARR